MIEAPDQHLERPVEARRGANFLREFVVDVVAVHGDRGHRRRGEEVIDDLGGIIHKPHLAVIIGAGREQFDRSELLLDREVCDPALLHVGFGNVADLDGV